MANNGRRAGIARVRGGARAAARQTVQDAFGGVRGRDLGAAAGGAANLAATMILRNKVLK